MPESYHRNRDAPENAQYGKMRFASIISAAGSGRQRRQPADVAILTSDEGMAITQFTQTRAADDRRRRISQQDGGKIRTEPGDILNERFNIAI